MVPGTFMKSDVQSILYTSNNIHMKMRLKEILLKNKSL